MTLEGDQQLDLGHLSNNRRRAPDVRLRQAQGGTVSPADFVGHELVVLFPPTATGIAAEELEDYGRCLPELDEIDAWLLAVCDEGDTPPDSRLAIVQDVDGTAWDAMTACAGVQDVLSRERGAAFIFGRGGSLQEAFVGPGQANAVVDQLRKRR